MSSSRRPVPPGALPPDLLGPEETDAVVIRTWSTLTQTGVDNLKFAKAVHEAYVGRVLQLWGVPAGEAGVEPRQPKCFR